MSCVYGRYTSRGSCHYYDPCTMANPANRPKNNGGYAPIVVASFANFYWWLW